MEIEYTNSTPKKKQGPRGKKTKAQKLRKAAAMDKALAVSSRQQTKVSKRDKKSAKKTAMKALWVNSSAKKAP